MEFWTMLGLGALVLIGIGAALLAEAFFNAPLMEFPDE